MRNNQDKVAQICEIHFTPIDCAQVIDHPGRPVIDVSAVWYKIPFSRAEFKEEQPGSGKIVKQEFSATVTGLNREIASSLQKTISKGCLLRLRYTNGESRLLGNEEFPVKLSLEISGSPAVYILSCNRSSSEFSKFFQSF